MSLCRFSLKAHRPGHWESAEENSHHCHKISGFHYSVCTAPFCRWQGTKICDAMFGPVLFKIVLSLHKFWPSVFLDINFLKKHSYDFCWIELGHGSGVTSSSGDQDWLHLTSELHLQHWKTLKTLQSNTRLLHLLLTVPIRKKGRDLSEEEAARLSVADHCVKKWRYKD